MSITKKEIVDDMHSLLTSEHQTNRFYYNKSVSFRYELEFSEICKRQKIKTLDGGMFLFRKNPEYYFVYLTISSDRKEDYSLFYESLRKIEKENLRHLFYAEIDGWEINKTTIKTKSNPEHILDISVPKKCPTIEKFKQKNQDTPILTPKMSFFEFEGGKWNPITAAEISKHFDKSRVSVYSRKQSFIKYMKDFPIESIRDVYCNRFFIDVNLRGTSQYMADIDKIIVDGSKFRLVEVKNKTPVFDKKFPNDLQHARFGWDFRRISWYLLLKEKSGMDIQYVVAHIDDRQNRKVVAWKDIRIDDWCRCADWGGDMQGNQMAPYKEFSDSFNK